MKNKLLRGVCGISVLLTACSSAVNPRVAVRPVTADLIFGIPKVDEPVGLPGGTDFSTPVALFPDFNAGKEIPARPVIPKIACAEASSREYKTIATNVFEHPPPLGEFKWKVVGSARVPGYSLTTPISLLQKHTIQNYTVLDPNPATNPNPKNPLEYTYDSIDPDAVGQTFKTTTWHVVKNKFVTPPNNVTSPQQAPGNGLFIRKIVTSTAGGETPFQPSPEVLVMPFGSEADGGDTFGFQDAYVDPTTQETWQLEGVVYGNRQFDACGQQIDTRWVDGYLKITSSKGTDELNYDYGVATQFGAILASDHREQCPRDFHYRNALPSYTDQTYRQTETDPGPNHEDQRCQRTSGAGSGGASVEYRPVDNKIDRNIGQVPPDYPS